MTRAGVWDGAGARSVGPGRRRLLVAGAAVWPFLAVAATICLGVWFWQTFLHFTWTAALEARGAAAPWYIVGLVLLAATLVLGWWLSRRWWPPLLAAAPGLAALIGEIVVPEPEMTVIPQLVYVVTIPVMITGLVFVFRYGTDRLTGARAAPISGEAEG
ncbi:hypothetical protein GCM10017608_33890 [Agromyces luteolus]|uniref:Uncharacterized protein n=1 Tax=Agromyces luteolus TaxID=88373 RepID=A0A7C9LT90_9MICO|nr:hypothetical protein [Agromyces luteolus]MUN07416.1 hypothetical protein [Agromyces luteolus]GLK29451.1 hypothetical protein GCM10017608_33890 [Agromyces luteolus]